MEYVFFIVGCLPVIVFIIFIDRASTKTSIIRANRSKKYTTFQDDLIKYRNKQK